MTRGEAGALITVDGQEYEIPPAKPEKVVDPTGAGRRLSSRLRDGDEPGTAPGPRSAAWPP